MQRTLKMWRIAFGFVLVVAALVAGLPYTTIVTAPVEVPQGNFAISARSMVCSGDVRAGWLMQQAYDRTDDIGAISLVSAFRPVFAGYGAHCEPLAGRKPTKAFNALAKRMMKVEGCRGTCRGVFYYENGQLGLRSF